MAPRNGLIVWAFLAAILPSRTAYPEGGDPVPLICDRVEACFNTPPMGDPDCTCTDYCDDSCPDEPACFLLSENCPFVDLFYDTTGLVGAPIELTLTDDDANRELHRNVIYVQWTDGSISDPATATNFSQSADLRGQWNQTLVIPSALRGFLHVRLRGSFAPGDPSYIVKFRARVVPLKFSGITLRKVPCGQCRFRATIFGGGFNELTTFRLEHPDSGARFDAIDVDVVSPERAEVELFCTDPQQSGDFDVVIAKAGVVCRAEDVVRVTGCGPEPPSGALVKASLDGFPRVSQDDPGVLHLLYENAGETALSPRLLRVRARIFDDTVMPPQETMEGILLRLMDRDVTGDPRPPLATLPLSSGSSEVYVLTVGANGVSELAPDQSKDVPGSARQPELTPGQLKDIGIEYVTDALIGRRIEFTASLLTPGSADELGDVAKPGSMPDAAWTEFLAHLRGPGQTGDRWDAYDDYLAGIASRVFRRFVPTFSTTKLLRFGAREALGLPRSSIAGTITDTDGVGYEGIWVTAARVGSAEILCAPTIAGGHYAFSCLADGEYLVSVNGATSGGVTFELPVDVPPGETVADVDITIDVVTPAMLGPLLERPAICSECAAADEAKLPDAPIEPPDSIFTDLTRYNVIVSDPSDPNEKEGPEVPDPLPPPGGSVWYKIHFENNGNVPIQNVKIEDTLSNQFDIASINFSDFGFSGQLYNYLYHGTYCYSSCYCYTSPSLIYNDLSNGRYFRLTDPLKWQPCGFTLPTRYFFEMRATYDFYSNKATWDLKTLDKHLCYYSSTCEYCFAPTGSVDACGLPNLPIGFLPHTDALHDLDGRGYVAFTVKLHPEPTVMPCDQIVNEALITFVDTGQMTPTSPSSSFNVAPGACLRAGGDARGGGGAADLPGRGAAGVTFRFPVPADGRTMRTDEPLQWEADGTDGPFSVEYWTGTPMVKVDPEDEPDLDRPCFYPEDLQGATTYFWQVTADMMPGPIWSFTTEPEPETVTLVVRPLDGSEVPGALGSVKPWKLGADVGGTTRFRLGVDIDSNLAAAPGVGAWSYSLFVDECLEVDAATIETAVDNVTFDRTRLIEPPGNGARGGIASVVVLDPDPALSLPPSGTVRVLEFAASMSGPSAAAGESTAPCILRFSEPGELPFETEDALGGPIPAEASATIDGRARQPGRIGRAVRLFPAQFLRGDTTGEGGINISDGVFLLNFLFLDAPEPQCLDAADADDDGQLNITDGIVILNFLFLGGLPPKAPHPVCGIDPTPDDVTCFQPHECG